MSRQFVMPRRYGGMRVSDFDALCRKIVLALAANNRNILATKAVVAHSKSSYAGEAAADVFTTADKSSEALFESLAGDFPQGIGYIGEEGLRRPCTLDDCDIYITIDPLDGTRAYIEAAKEWRQLRPGEVSVMLGVLVGEKGMSSRLKSVAGYICDVADDTLYCLSPNSSHVERIVGDSHVDMSRIPASRVVRSGNLLVHRSMNPNAPSPIPSNDIASRLMQPASQGGVFGNVSIGYGSIGLKVASVFAGEFAAMLRPNSTGFYTPWDEGPLQAFCRIGHVKTFVILADGLQEIVVAEGRIDRVSRRSQEVLYLPDRLIRDVRQSGIAVTTL